MAMTTVELQWFRSDIEVQEKQIERIEDNARRLRWLAELAILAVDVEAELVTRPSWEQK